MTTRQTQACSGSDSPPAPVNGRVSYWFTEIGGLPEPRPLLQGAAQADVCIVGAGFTGLWAAYYLMRAEPSLEICVVEAEFAGFGASGRNGGWLSGLVPGSRQRLAARYGRDAVSEMQRIMNSTVDEVIQTAASEQLAGVGPKGGTLRVATSPAQVDRLHRSVAEDHEWGVLDVELLSAEDAGKLIRVPRTQIAAWNPHCASIQPAALVRSLARRIEQMGVRIYERSPVTRIRPGGITTPSGTVTAKVVIRATEGFTAGLPGHRRTWLPMNSSVMVTEPLPEEVWDDIGWNAGQTLGDCSHIHMYAQRTADDRIAIGGRGIPYRFGSRPDDGGRITHASTIAQLHHSLVRALPQAGNPRIDHAWCGVLAVPRDWCASVHWDGATGLASAGGYVGHGVTSANLAGQTLRDLILGRDTDLTRLPWVGHQSRPWEPEPFRWLGAHALYQAYRYADQREARGLLHTSSVARIASRIAGTN